MVFYVRYDFSLVKLVRADAFRQNQCCQLRTRVLTEALIFEFKFTHLIVDFFSLCEKFIFVNFFCQFYLTDELYFLSFFHPDDNVLHYTVLWSPNRFKFLISYAVYSIFLLILLVKNRICQRRVTYRYRERLMIATDKF